MNSEATITKSIDESVKRTFADMAFIDVERNSGNIPAFQTSHLVHISFSEPVEGEMVLFLPTECKVKIVENIYGQEWDQMDPSAVDDCLLEILNVIAGNFLNGYCGCRTKHNLSLPTLIFDLEEIHRLSRVHEFYFDAEDAPLKVLLRLEE